jgi:hypothetical protein
MARDTTFWLGQLTKLKAIADAYADAIAAFAASDNVEEYRLDTGQTNVRVKRTDLEWMQSTLDKALVRVQELENLIGGCGVMRNNGK